MRNGTAVVYARNASEDASIMGKFAGQQLDDGRTSADYNTQNTDPTNSDLAGTAGRILAAAAEMPAILKSDTVAQGITARRLDGRRLGTKLERAVRALDAAGGFVRHPWKVAQVSASLRAWAAGGEVEN